MPHVDICLARAQKTLLPTQVREDRHPRLVHLKTSPEAPLHVGNVTIDPARRQVTVAEQPVEMRPKEFDLLLALAEHRGAVHGAAFGGNSPAVFGQEGGHWPGSR